MGYRDGFYCFQCSGGKGVEGRGVGHERKQPVLEEEGRLLGEGPAARLQPQEERATQVRHPSAVGHQVSRHRPSVINGRQSIETTNAQP